MKTNMAVLYQCGAPLVVEEVEVPPLEAGQVLVRVMFSGVCGSQLGEIKGRTGPDRYLPHTLGHEGAGIVEDLGKGVTKVRVGDRVVISWIKGSGLNGPPPSYRKGNRKINAGFAVTFTEYTIASENRLVPIAAEMPLDKASILGCAVSTGFGAVVNAGTSPASDVVVVGTGGVAISAIQAAALSNAARILVLGRSDAKLAVARAFGATHVLNLSDPELELKVIQLTNGHGAGFAFDAVGERSTMELAYRCARPDAGRVVLIGVPRHQERISISPADLFSGKTVTGSVGGDSTPDTDIPRYVRLYLSGKLDLDRMITHRFPLHDVNAALEALEAGGEVIRAVLEL